MASLEIIRKITIQASSQGVDETSRKLEKLSDAQTDVASSANESARASLTISQALERYQRSADATLRSVNQISQAQNDFVQAQKAANDNAREAGTSFHFTGIEAASAAAHLKTVAVAAYALSPAFRGLVNTGLVESFKILGPAAATAAASIASALVPALSAALSFIVRIGIPILAVVEGVRLLGTAFEVGAQKIEEFNRIAKEAGTAGVSTTFFQQQSKAAEEYGAAIDSASKAMQKFNDITQQRLGGSTFEKEVDRLVELGNFANNAGVAALRQANTTEERWRAVTRLITEAMDIGERTAALSLAEKFLPPDMLERLRAVPTFLADLQKTADEIKPVDVVPPAQIALAIELKERLDAANKTIQQDWSSRLTEAGLQIQSIWIAVLELFARVVSAISSLIDWFTKLGQIAQGFADTISGLLSKQLPSGAQIPAGVTEVPTGQEGFGIQTARKNLAELMRDHQNLQRAMKETGEIQTKVLGDKSVSEAVKETGNNARGAASEFERLARSLERQAASQEGEIAAVGKGVGETARLRAEHRLLEAAQQDGIAVTGEFQRRIEELSRRVGDAAQKLAELQAMSRAKFEMEIVFFSPEEQRIAREMNRLYGPEWQANMNGSLASMMRFNDVLKTLNRSITDFATTFIEGLVKGESLTKSLTTALSGLSSVLIRMGTQQALGGLLGGVGGTAGGLLGGAGGGAAAGGLLGGIPLIGPVILGVGVALGFLSSSMEKTRQKAEEAKRKVEEAAERLRQAQEAWASMSTEFSDFVAEASGMKPGSFTMSIRSIREEMEKFTKAAREAQAGPGVETQIHTAGIIQMRNLLEEISQAAPQLGEVGQDLKDVFDQFTGLQAELTKAGFSAEEAADLIDRALIGALDRLKQKIATDLERDINEFMGKGWINQISEILQKFSEISVNNLADPEVLSKWLTLALQNVIDQAQLTGPEFEELMKIFPQLGTRVHEFTDTVKRSAKEIADARQTLEDRLFAAQTDTSTLAGALADFDRRAQRDLAEEIRKGGENLLLLEQVISAERANIIADFARQAIEEERRAAEERQRILEEAQRTLDAFTRKIKEFIAGLKTGTESPLSPQQRFVEAQANFAEQLAIINTGTAQERREAMGSITQFAQQLLEASKAFSPAGFPALFESVVAQLEALPDQISVQELILEAVEATDASIQSMRTALLSALATGNLDIIRSSLLTYLPKIDTNSDNAISFPEMLAAFGTNFNSGTLRAIFDMLDLNHDGILDQVELMGISRTQNDTQISLASQMKSLLDSITSLNFALLSLTQNLLSFSTAQYLSLVTMQDLLSIANVQYNEFLPRLRAIAFNTMGQPAWTFDDSGLYRLIPGTYVSWGVQTLARGGFVHGEGTGTSDSIRARLSAGEFVVNAQQASRHSQLLQSINSGGGSANDNDLLAEVRALRAEVASLRRITGAGHAIVREGIDKLVMNSDDQLANEKLRSAS